jgi:hypothetical protein
VIDGRPITLVPLFTFEIREPARTASRVEYRTTGSVIVVDILPETQSRATLAAG